MCLLDTPLLANRLLACGAGGGCQRCCEGLAKDGKMARFGLIKLR
jgi:hypothetical protein